MAKNLVIVESPAKAKTIVRYLGKGYTVKASVGHIKDLPKSKLGVDVDDNFQPTYQIIKDKKKVIDDICKAATTSDAIFLALDPDREGEAIAWHVADEIKGKCKKKTPPIQRILFNEITKKAVKEAIAQPKELDLHLYEAQQARRILDRLVGYKISPILWDKVQRGLSAGRVQSIAVRLVCERDAEIQKFKAEEYWSIHAQLKTEEGAKFQSNLIEYDGKKMKVGNQKDADSMVQALRKADYQLTQLIRKERKRHPVPPFITSKLQQEAARKLGFTAKRTMSIAQQLYEGVEVGEEGPVGLISYMRTDSTRIAGSALDEVRDWIQKHFDKDHLPETPNFYKSKKGAQDAHEAIRPTSMEYEPAKISKYLSKEQMKLYDLIWKRFVASQMTSAIYDSTSADITAGKGLFRATGSVMKFAGFTAIYLEGQDDPNPQDEEDKALPDLKEGEALSLVTLNPEQHFTEPPPRYTEASLIKDLEEKGIGRPSTYASIMSTIQDKKYVAKDQNRFQATRLGTIVNELLVDNFPNIMDVAFTAKMEEELDEVEEGQREYVETLKDFYNPFSKNLEEAKLNMKNIKRQETPTDFQCTECQSPMVIKWGRRGEFLACTNYPQCRYTREIQRDEEGDVQLMKREVTGEFCGKCGAQMIIKTGRFGKFLACSNYPDCKSTKALTIGIKCPKCESGKVTERRTRKGRIFYGCSNYPKCDFATWDRPLKESCPKCASPFLVQKFSKKEGARVVCPNKECDFVKETTDEASASLGASSSTG